MNGEKTFMGRSSTLWAAIAAFALLGLSAARSEAADPGRVDRTSNSSFTATLKKLETTLKAEHMMVVAKVDHRNMLAMVGAKIKGATTVEFGKPDMGKMLLPMNPALGLEMPAKIYVYETADGKVVVSYRKVASGFATYENPDVTKAGEMMDMMLDKITASVTR